MQSCDQRLKCITKEKINDPLVGLMTEINNKKNC